MAPCGQSSDIRPNDRARAQVSRTRQSSEGQPHLRSATLYHSIEPAYGRFREPARCQEYDASYSRQRTTLGTSCVRCAAEVDRQRPNLRMSEETAVGAPKNSVFGVPCLPRSGSMPALAIQRETAGQAPRTPPDSQISDARSPMPPDASYGSRMTNSSISTRSSIPANPKTKSLSQKHVDCR